LKLKTDFKFAIAGGGLTATSMLCQLVEKLESRASSGRVDPHSIEIAIFEKTTDFGPGFPHNKKYLMPFHVTNMCANDMSVYAARPGDFQAWVDQNMGQLKRRFSAYPAEMLRSSSPRPPCNHYPRAFMGEYLQSRFREAVASARQLGLTVNLYPLHEITDARRRASRIEVAVRHIASGSRFVHKVHAILLATGHWLQDTGGENYFESPWPAEKLLSSIPRGASVAVIGTSLSAIETVLTLTSEGEFVGDVRRGLTYVPPRNPRKITLYSRRGLLPRVRGRQGEYSNRFLTTTVFRESLGKNRNPWTLETTLRLLKMELSTAYGRPIDWEKATQPGLTPESMLRLSIKDAVYGDEPGGAVIWQTVLSQTFNFIREWYLHLPEGDRHRFDGDFTTLFFTHAATQPLANAAKLLALMKAKIVRVKKLGMKYRLTHDRAQSFYRFEYNDTTGRFRRDVFRYVVNAQGQKRSMATDPSELAKNLVASGSVRFGNGLAALHPSSNQSLASEKLNGASSNYPAGSVEIDPETHRVPILSSRQPGPGVVYAVGAMTRGQIIDASMAHGICRSTDKVAESILDIVAKS
jgi:uncharacterized NAD(P)/FAD-binding protein YdhS